MIRPSTCWECPDISTCPHKKQRAIDRCVEQHSYLGEMKANWERMTQEERDANLKKNLDELYGPGTYDAHLRQLAERDKLKEEK